MGERIITAEEARALREAATPGPWRRVRALGALRVVAHNGYIVSTVDETVGGPADGDAAIIAAAPDLAASVEHYAAEASAARQALALENEIADLRAAATAESRRVLYTAEEARALREAAEQGPYECCDDLLIWASEYEGFDPIGSAADRLDEPKALATGTLLAASWGLAASVEHYAAEVERLQRRWDRQADRWCVLLPEGGAEWFDTRPEAEGFATDWMTEVMRDTGEAHDEQCVVLAVVSHTEEIVGARRDDGSERGEWLRERGLDYEVEGYRCTPGPEAHVREGVDHPAAAKERRRIAAWLREEADGADSEACGAFNPYAVADAIERGEHLGDDS